MDAPDKETEISIDFEKGIPVGLNGKKLSPIKILTELNGIGSENGIGRADIVETRVVGMKSHGVYETPGGTILNKALREIEMMTLDADSLNYKNLLSVQYANLVYAGKWHSPVRESLEAFMEKISEYSTGTVRLVLYKGNIIVTGRESAFSLYFKDLASFGKSSYNHEDAAGFINLFGLSTGIHAIVHKKIDKNTGEAPTLKEIARFHEK
jgi:argininosuccinate synthase